MLGHVSAVCAGTKLDEIGP